VTGFDKNWTIDPIRSTAATPNSTPDAIVTAPPPDPRSPHPTLPHPSYSDGASGDRGQCRTRPRPVYPRRGARSATECSEKPLRGNDLRGARRRSSVMSAWFGLRVSTPLATNVASRDGTRRHRPSRSGQQSPRPRRGRTARWSRRWPSSIMSMGLVTLLVTSCRYRTPMWGSTWCPPRGSNPEPTD
jgi:hypothetical protein